MDCRCGKLPRWRSTRPSWALCRGMGLHVRGPIASPAKLQPTQAPNHLPCATGVPTWPAGRAVEVGGRFGAELADFLRRLAASKATFVATRAPPSRQIRAAARSKGAPRRYSFLFFLFFLFLPRAFLQLGQDFVQVWRRSAFRKSRSTSCSYLAILPSHSSTPLPLALLYRKGWVGPKT